ncbi:MAG: 2,3-bisphosphoglycerate-independent phosphoglycerate mutase [Candidatus Omnitrophica bacterium]|nr:2,3-bisphosphoglycerate-independent phosphoglycerate mutase [Candidatus Omnitrophota bacterium]MBD3269363.1 2,3-bisphosphoglycerate-independent phosphoglycerate mutase [Candidatus Omnitrophota bacterium]
MVDFDTLKSLAQKGKTKILFYVIDGLGGLAESPGGLTELEKANTPNMDELAKDSVCGLHVPVACGITPGSGPAHLALFGYDSLKYEVGRGVLSALGVDFDLKEQDVAARGNFCTLGKEGLVSDRRAGRISTEENKRLCDKLSQIRIEGAGVFIKTVKEHRFLLVLRGEGLSADIEDTDPQQEGKQPLPVEAKGEGAEFSRKVLREFLDKAREILAGEYPANMVLLRGFSRKPDWPSLEDIFGIRCVSIAGYPMYRGLSRLLGMEVLPCEEKMESKIEVLQKNKKDFDFFYLHFKSTDSRGEDGDFNSKVKSIEEADQALARLRQLGFDVIVVTGDHSTPAAMAYHSWHPVPVMLWSKKCRADKVEKFSEQACLGGALGPNLAAVNLMPLALANAGRLAKFGA